MFRSRAPPGETRRRRGGFGRFVIGVGQPGGAKPFAGSRRGNLEPLARGTGKTRPIPPPNESPSPPRTTEKSTHPTVAGTGFHGANSADIRRPWRAGTISAVGPLVIEGADHVRPVVVVESDPLRATCTDLELRNIHIRRVLPVNVRPPPRWCWSAPSD